MITISVYLLMSLGLFSVLYFSAKREYINHYKVRHPKSTFRDYYDDETMEGDIWCAFAWPITIPMAVIRWIISKKR